MGCAASSPAVATGGVVEPAPCSAPAMGSNESDSDAAAAASSWHLGDEIDRPPNSTCTAVYYVDRDADDERRPAASRGRRVLRVSYAACSAQGRNARPPQKPNQDTFMCALPLSAEKRDLLVFGVFDGHGPHGEDAAHFCRTQLGRVIRDRREYAASPLDAVARAFEPLHRQLVSPAAAASSDATPYSLSGCVAIVLAMVGERYVVANVGDSRAILGSTVGPPAVGGIERGGSSGGEARLALAVRALSTDHKPTRPDERARIERTNARILSEAALGIDGGAADKFYICRTQGGAIRYGVLFTRSLGDADAHEHLGLTAEPETQRGTLRPGVDRFIVLASDGVWDVMDEEAVARCVADAGDDAHSAAGAIVAAAAELWDRGGFERRDDITVVVVAFAWPPEGDAAAAAALAAQHAQRLHGVSDSEEAAPAERSTTASRPTSGAPSAAVEVMAVPPRGSPLAIG